MTGDLQRIWHKWLFYRKLLIGLFLLNVFCVASGFVLSFNFWGFKQNLRDQHQVELQRLMKASDLEPLITKLEYGLRQPGKSDRADLIMEVKAWQTLEDTLVMAGLIDRFPVREEYLTQPKAGLEFLDRVKNSLTLERRSTFEKLSQMVKAHSDTTRELVAIGVFTLLFGLIIPAFIVWMMSRLLKRTLNQMRETARELVQDWLRQSQKYGDQAFRNIEFWVELLLLAAQYTGRTARHPMAQLAGELAHLVRHELDKSRESKAA